MRAKVINIPESVLSIFTKKAQTITELNTGIVTNLVKTTNSIRRIEVYTPEEVQSISSTKGSFEPFVSESKMIKKSFFRFLKSLPKACAYSIHR